MASQPPSEIAAPPARAVSEHPVVACYRGSDSADAVQLGALLAAAIGEPLVLAHAYRYEPAGLSARALPAPGNERRAVAARSNVRRARRFARADVEVRDRIVPATGVADALVALAREVAACVLVLGRDTEGHLTRSLVPRAPCPVAIAPPLSVPLPTDSAFGRIGVAYDGSPSAQWALTAARRLARVTGARLDVLAAGPTSEHAATWLHIARLSIGTTLRYETHAIAGDPSVELTRASAGLDLLVCGSRGRSRPLAAILGSVSGHLAAHARCPILVVPPGVGYAAEGPLGLATAAA
jgi:nucleotide-binding universal stress UspA family protein